MSVQLIPDWRIISTEMMIKVIQESNENNERFCFILGSGASIESGIASGIELEKRWMDYLMGESKDEKNPLGDPQIVRDYAKKLKDDGVIQYDFSQIENDWKDNKLSSEYYFDLYTLRFYPDYNNGYRYLEKQMESAEPSLGYRILAKLLTDGKKNNLVITTNFDSLTEDALFLYTDKKPLVVNHELLADYISVPSIDRPIVAKIHRGLFFNPLNSRDDTNKLSKEWREALSSVFQIFTPIVIGYGGGDHSLMDFLRDENVKIRNKIYWCYIPKYGFPNETIQNLINDKDGFLVEVDGFDSFMADIGSKFYSTEITPPETTNILQQRCNLRIDQYNKRWSELHSDSQQVKELKNLEVALEMKREESETLSYFDYFRRGIACAKNKQFQKAIDCFNKSIEINGDFAPTYNSRGNSYADLKQYDKAVEDYNKAIELNPNDSMVYCNRGNSYSNLKQYDNAIEDYNKAIELNPNNSDAYCNRGTSYANLNQYDKSIENFNKAIEIDSDFSIAYSDRSEVYVVLKQYDKAMEDSNKAIELDSNNSEAYKNRGDAYAGLEQCDNALEDYNKAIELNPEFKEAYIGRAKVYRLLDKPDLAELDEAKAKEDEDK
ncbi:MAG: tetratricopeptide repeat protein [Oscillospiraceae bacterium]|nr:tetratricopeptide repeat protein [Oscillospiraceae bacterium]